MLFYHYSEIEFDELKSLVAQGKQGRDSEIERNAGFFDKLSNSVLQMLFRLSPKGEFEYNRHISLFLEPIPLNLPSIWEHKHEFWKSGLELFEYTVELKDIPENISFHLIETPEQIRLLYEKQDWELAKDHPELIPKFKKEIIDMENSKGYRGHGKNNMVRVCRRFTRGINRYYQHAVQLSKDYPEDGLNRKYAACVPHLMIYPGYLPIPVASVKKVALR